MKVPKNYFHDKTVLLLLSVNTFIALLSSLYLVLRIDFGEPYIVQYRGGLTGQDFVRDEATAFLYFVGFAIFTILLHWLVSMKMYYKRRHYSYVMLILGLILLIFAVVVSNSLIGSPI